VESTLTTAHVMTNRFTFKTSNLHSSCDASFFPTSRVDDSVPFARFCLVRERDPCSSPLPDSNSNAVIEIEEFFYYTLCAKGFCRDKVGRRRNPDLMTTAYANQRLELLGCGHSDVAVAHLPLRDHVHDLHTAQQDARCGNSGIRAWVQCCINKKS
jgi:hypothetical protein